MYTKNRDTVQKSRGFTIVEIFVVIAVIGVLLAIGIGSWSSSQNRSKKETAVAVAEKVKLSLGKYFTSYDRYPATQSKVTNYLTTQGDTSLATSFGDTTKFVYSGTTASGGACDDTTAARCEKYTITVKKTIWQGGTSDTDVTVMP